MKRFDTIYRKKKKGYTITAAVNYWGRPEEKTVITGVWANSQNPFYDNLKETDDGK